MRDSSGFKPSEAAWEVDEEESLARGFDRVKRAVFLYPAAHGVKEAPRRRTDARDNTKSADCGEIIMVNRGRSRFERMDGLDWKARKSG